MLASAPLTGESAAQTAEVEAWTLETLTPPLHALGGLGIEAGRLAHGAVAPGGGLLFSYAAMPLSERPGADASGDGPLAVVEGYGSAWAWASLAFLGHGSIAVAMPFRFGLVGSQPTGEPLDVFGVGDARVSLKGALLPPRDHGVGLAAQVDVVVPTGTDGTWGHERGVSVIGRVAADVIVGVARVTANAWGRWRERWVEAPDAYWLDGAPQLRQPMHVHHAIGADLGVALTAEPVGVTAFVELAFQSPLARVFETASTQLEARAGVRWEHASGVGVTAGVGFGLTPGWGNPVARGIVGVGYHLAPLLSRPEAPAAQDPLPAQDPGPEPEPEPEPVAPPPPPPPPPNAPGDQDGDGVPDADDRCRAVAEDIDGHEDADGCPDLDDDGDGVPDTEDRCRLAAEDRDGFEDADGCPDPDNDGDGLVDTRDGCPVDAEDKDGFQDSDGCPDLDDDSDGIPDARDRCPRRPEDLDGCEDADGCPEQTRVCVEEERLVIRDKIYFQTGKARIRARSYDLLEELADVLRAHPEVRRVRIEGHTDDRGSDRRNQALSEARAEAVWRFLVERQGLGAARLRWKGYGESRPIGDNRTRQGRERNRRVEFVIEGRAPAPPTEPPAGPPAKPDILKPDGAARDRAGEGR